MENKVKVFFRRRAQDYIERYNRPTLIDLIFRKSIFLRSKKVREEYAVFARGSVLDIGCGAGIQVFQLGELGADVTGIDFSEKMILRANEVLKSYRGKGNVDFICADFCSFNFERKFDMVIALALFD